MGASAWLDAQNGGNKVNEPAPSGRCAVVSAQILALRIGEACSEVGSRAGRRLVEGSYVVGNGRYVSPCIIRH
jgi:hypothetical protein